MVVMVIGSCALLTAVLALALLREIRLRKALEALLRKLLNTWRKLHGPKTTGTNETDPGQSDGARRL
jgi:hypothetical protein